MQIETGLFRLREGIRKKDLLIFGHCPKGGGSYRIKIVQGTFFCLVLDVFPGGADSVKKVLSISMIDIELCKKIGLYFSTWIACPGKPRK